MLFWMVFPACALSTPDAPYSGTSDIGFTSSTSHAIPSAWSGTIGSPTLLYRTYGNNLTISSGTNPVWRFTFPVDIPAGSYYLSGAFNVFFTCEANTVVSSYLTNSATAIVSFQAGYSGPVLYTSPSRYASSGYFYFNQTPATLSQRATVCVIEIHYSGSFSLVSGSSTGLGFSAYHNFYCHFSESLNMSPNPDYQLRDVISRLDTVISSLGSGSSDYTSILQGIRSDISGVKDILTSSAQQDSASNDFKDEMQSTLDKIDEANQTIEDNTNRPTMEELRPPDVSTIVDASDPGYAAAMEGIGSFLAADFMVNILLLMCTMAFCGYVLFGKKG